MAGGIIRPLPPEVIGQIAAGEVVERPASAIKELVENSIDAGASSIAVDLRDGGLTSFRVTDNGQGIPREDIAMAFARHATSKIRNAEDLWGVRSLGFRGEALASIAAVSKVTCLTRRRNEESGIRAVNEGGQMISVEETGCPEGTSFTVRDLFFNAPVRRKFLKKASFETAAVSDLMERLILSRPDISFRFIADGKTVYFSSGDGVLKNACLAVFGLGALRQMTAVQGTEGGLCLSGMVGTGDAARGNRSKEFFFLNQRVMKSNLLSAAVEDACRQLVTIGRFPICVLHLTLPYDSVDVNVHPNKWEVRFTNEAAVREAVCNLIADCLHQDMRREERIPALLPEERPVQLPVSVERIQGTPAQPSAAERVPEEPEKTAPSPIGVIPPSRPSAPVNSFAPAATRQPAAVLHDKPALFTAPIVNTFPAAKPDTAEKEAEPAAENTQLPLPETDPVKMIGTAFDTYILLEYGSRLLLCDQHAIHERLLYEKFMAQSAENACQPLLVPIILELTHSEFTVYTENVQALKEAGFDTDLFGERTVRLLSLPLILGEPQAAKCFREALDELSSRGSISGLERVQRIIQLSCKHAVKGGEKLPPDALQELVTRMLRDDIRLTCPHGRPLMIELSRADIEKRFKRIQERGES